MAINRKRNKVSCSCGKSFTTELGLKRHRAMGNCGGEEVAEPPAQQLVADEPEDRFGEEEPIARIPATPVATRVEVPASPALERFERGLSRFDCFVTEFIAWLTEGVRAFSRALVPTRDGLALAVRGLMAVTVMSVLFFALIMVALSTQRATAAPGPRPADAAQTVSDFHQALRAEAYASAYRRLSPAWQAGIEYPDFAAHCAGMKYGDWKLGQIEMTGPFTARVAVDLRVRVEAQPQLLRGYYTLTHNGQRWQVDQIQMDRV
ncbi:MAG: hypothetical protein AB7S38_10760 [Vulcanimicrobiota bacterium]